MKHKICAIFMLVCCLFYVASVETIAMSTGFNTIAPTQEEKDLALSNINISPINADTRKKTIACFDVNKKDLIAIGRKSFNKGQICVYSSSGAFLYGYEFYETGDFAIEWDEDNINVYSVRGDCVFSVDASGRIVDYRTGADTKSNVKYYQQLRSMTSKVVGETEYMLQNDIGFLDFFTVENSQIVAKYSNGDTFMIYDAGSTMLFYSICKMILLVALVSIVVIVVLSRCFKISKSKHKKGTSI